MTTEGFSDGVQGQDGRLGESQGGANVAGSEKSVQSLKETSNHPKTAAV